MANFWSTLERPFFVLAPMEDVTDAAFRKLISQKGKPSVMFTEFTSADGLMKAPEEGKKSLLRKFLYSEGERPIVAQIFTSIPEHMEQASALVRELGFDGVDINMGCPDRAVEKQGCGSALIKAPSLARELIRAAKRGAGELPVSVKTRIGYATNELESWLPELLSEEPAAITVHARTRNELSEVPARWETIEQAVAIRNAQGSSTYILGNGDVKDLADARTKVQETGADGVMLGRAIYGNPWLFSEHIPSQEEKVSALIEHLQLFDELLNGMTSYSVMKKHFKAYISGWDGAKELRAQLMETDTVGDAIALLRSSF